MRVNINCVSIVGLKAGFSHSSGFTHSYKIKAVKLLTSFATDTKMAGLRHGVGISVHLLLTWFACNSTVVETHIHICTWKTHTHTHTHTQ